MYVYSLMDEDHFDINLLHESENDALEAGIEELKRKVKEGDVKADEDEPYYVYTGKVVYPDLKEILDDAGIGFDIISIVTGCLESWIEDEYSGCITIGNPLKWIKKLRAIDGINKKVESSFLEVITKNIPNEPKEDFSLVVGVTENEVDDYEIDAFIYDLIYRNPVGETIPTRCASIDEARKVAEAVHTTNNGNDFVVLKYSIKTWELVHIYERGEVIGHKSE